jgi:hypothetical protein
MFVLATRWNTTADPLNSNLRWTKRVWSVSRRQINGTSVMDAAAQGCMQR